MQSSNDCISGPDVEQVRRDLRKEQIEKGLLCAAFSFIEKNDFNEFIENTSWEEIGVTKKEALDWWKEHKRADEQRKKQEQQKAEKEKIIKNALAKLSEEERKALNLPTKLVKTKG